MENMIDKIGVFALGILIIITIIAITKWHDYSQERKLKELVSWCLIKEKPYELLMHAHDLPLWAYISNAQINLQVSQKYRIEGDEEWGFVKEILEEYQKDLTRSYFKGHLRMIKSKYAIDGDVYFMLTLQSFLNDHQCEYKFLDHDMHAETVSYKRYGDWGGPCFDATYSLTDFAVTYHKLYYTTYLFCKNSKITNPSGESFQNERFIKDILDAQQIQLSRG